MRNAILLAALCLSAPLPGQPQDSGSTLPVLVVRASMLPMMQNLKQSANLAADLRVSEGISADLGMGWMLGSFVFARYRGESYQGPRFRAGIKYFLHSDERQAVHIGAELTYQDILHRKYRSALRQGGQYAERILDRRHVRTTGLYLRTGMHFYLGRHRRWLLEPQAGLGIRLHEVWRGNAPDVEIMPPGRGTLFTFEYPDGKCRNLHLLVALQLGYVLW